MILGKGEDNSKQFGVYTEISLSVFLSVCLLSICVQNVGNFVAN